MRLYQRPAVVDLSDNTLRVGRASFEGEAAVEEISRLLTQGRRIIAVNTETDTLYSNVRACGPDSKEASEQEESFNLGPVALAGKPKPLRQTEVRRKVVKVGAGALAAGLIVALVATKTLAPPPDIADIQKVSQQIEMTHTPEEISHLTQIRDGMINKALRASHLPQLSSQQVDNAYEYFKSAMRCSDEDVARMLLLGWTPEKHRASEEGIARFFKDMGVKNPLVVGMPPSDVEDPGIMSVIPSNIGMIIMVYYGNPQSVRYLPEHSYDITAHEMGHVFEGIYYGATTREGKGWSGVGGQVKAQILKKQPSLRDDYRIIEQYFGKNPEGYFNAEDTLEEVRSDAIGGLIIRGSWLSWAQVNSEIRYVELHGIEKIKGVREELQQLAYATASAEIIQDSQSVEKLREYLASATEGDPQAAAACQAFISACKVNWDYAVGMKDKYLLKYRKFLQQQDAEETHKKAIRESDRHLREQGQAELQRGLATQAERRPPQFNRRM